MDEENFMKDDCQPPLIGVVTTVIPRPPGPAGTVRLSLGFRIPEPGKAETSNLGFVNLAKTA